MHDNDVKKLSGQLDAAQALLDEIRITSGCNAFESAKLSTLKRTETALETAIRAYEERQKRGDFVGKNEIFGEPAWDMLLELFIRQAKEEEVIVKSTDQNHHAPMSTCARWLRILEQSELINIVPDPTDSSRYLIHLTSTGYEGMLRYLEAIGR